MGFWMRESDFFDPGALQESTGKTSKVKEEPTPKKKEKSKKKKKKEKKEKPTKNSSVRFHPRTVGQWLTYFFYFTFLTMCVVSFLTFSRMNQLSQIASSGVKEAREVANIALKSSQEGDWSRYIGQEFLTTYFTVEDGMSRQDMEEKLQEYLAQGVSTNDLLQFSNGTTREVLFIQAITQTEKEEDDGRVFETIYDVDFKENDQKHSVRVSLITHVANGEVKLLHPPSFLSRQLPHNEAGNTVKGKVNEFLTEGELVDEVETERIVSFIEDFLALYVKNDGNLKLISHVSGIEADEVRKIDVLNLVKKQEHFIAEVTYEFSFSEGIFYTSTARLKISGADSSYFLEELEPF